MPNAIRFHKSGGPEVLVSEPVPIGKPGPGEARVRHTAVGRKPNGRIRDGVVAHGQPIGLAVERISRKWKCSLAGHADTGPWAN
jgi:NADPH:quinone reductase-like Zn-dependent oxidoreductase